jgi:hypothetical protein
VIASSSADNMIKLWTINLSEKKNAIKPKLSLTQQSYEILGMKQVPNRMIARLFKINS